MHGFEDTVMASSSMDYASEDGFKLSQKNYIKNGYLIRETYDNWQR